MAAFRVTTLLASLLASLLTIAVGAARSQRCRAHSGQYTWDLAPLSGQPLVHRVTLDAKKAAAATLAAAVLVAGPAMPAKADLTSDLLARTEANKELNDKKRAATSSASGCR